MTLPSDLDLALCDQEPVAFIGTIQPFGILLVIDEGTARIEQASENCASALGVEWSDLLGSSVDRVLGENLLHALRKRQSHITTGNWTGTVHWTGKRAVISLEPVTPGAPTLASLVRLSEILARLQKAGCLGELCDWISEEIRDLTGFDRVMIYRFHDDLHGEVIAESRADAGEVESYLGLHFPASDIPAPSRAQFLSNWIRVIPQVDHEPVPIRRSRGTESEASDPSPLDLSQSPLRGVSPIHIEYLKNMKVEGSMTISILVERKLWGLIACHHRSPRKSAFEERTLIELFGRLVSTLIEERSRTDEEFLRAPRRECLESFLRGLQSADDIASVLLNGAVRLEGLIESTGFACNLAGEGQWTASGDTPPESQLDAVAAWLSTENGNADIFHTHSLASLFPEGLAYRKNASGLLSISVPGNQPRFLLFFRREILRTVNWAGSPRKAFQRRKGDPRLHPRNSFKSWKQSVDLESQPWRPWELEIARDLRNAILDQGMRIESVKAREADENARNRGEFMATLSHDLKGPLQSIELALSIIPRLEPALGTRSRELLENMGKTAKKMQQLIEGILDLTRIEANRLPLDRREFDAVEVIQETIAIYGAAASAKGISITTEIGQKTIFLNGDRVRTYQVFSNLLSNAIKFSPRGGAITIGARASDPEWAEFHVSDNGPGIEAKDIPSLFTRFWQAPGARRPGTGLGLSISRGIIEAHGGRIWVHTKPGGGSSFLFTLPRAVRRSRSAA